MYPCSIVAWKLCFRNWDWTFNSSIHFVWNDTSFMHLFVWPKMIPSMCSPDSNRIRMDIKKIFFDKENYHFEYLTSKSACLNRNKDDGKNGLWYLWISSMDAYFFFFSVGSITFTNLILIKYFAYTTTAAATPTIKL